MGGAKGVDQLLGKYLASKSDDFKQHVMKHTDDSLHCGLNSHKNLEHNKNMI